MCDVSLGIAGASYIPIVQAALPRLLGAAAPPGAAASENRRQCIKVIAPCSQFDRPLFCAEDNEHNLHHPLGFTVMA